MEESWAYAINTNNSKMHYHFNRGKNRKKYFLFFWMYYFDESIVIYVWPIVLALAVPIACSFESDAGSCRNYTDMWYYHQSSDRCRRFLYGGCEGNENRFSQEDTCIILCSQNPPTTTFSPTVLDGRSARSEATRHHSFSYDFCLMLDWCISGL